MGWPKGKKQSEESIRKRAAANCGKVRSPEARERIRRALTGVSHTEERRRNNGEGHRGLRHSDEAKKKVGDFFRGKPLSEEHKQKLRKPHNNGRAISEALRRSPKFAAAMIALRGHTFNVGRRKTEETRRKLGNSLRTSPKAIAHRQRLRRYRGTTIELFIKDCLIAHGCNFTYQDDIPGFAEAAGHRHDWDFLLPDKKIAIEVDGEYWHGPRFNGYDPVAECINVDWANYLGWRVTRVPERTLRASKPFKKWLKAHKAKG
jgi:DNA mismatch endonuclease Vsr